MDIKTKRLPFLQDPPDMRFSNELDCYSLHFMDDGTDSKVDIVKLSEFLNNCEKYYKFTRRETSTKTYLP